MKFNIVQAFCFCAPGFQGLLDVIPSRSFDSSLFGLPFSNGTILRALDDASPLFMLKDFGGKLRLRLLYSCDCLDEAIAAQCEDPIRVPLQDLDQVEWKEGMEENDNDDNHDHTGKSAPPRFEIGYCACICSIKAGSVGWIRVSTAFFGLGPAVWGGGVLSVQCLRWCRQLSGMQLRVQL